MYRMFDDRLGSEVIGKGIKSEVIEEWKDEII